MGTAASSRFFECVVLMLPTMLPVLALLNSLDPDGESGSPRGRYGGLAAAGRVGEGEESKSKQVTMFLGLAGSACCMYDGGVEPKVLLCMYCREATRGSRGNAVGWYEGRVVTMLVTGRNGLLCIARPGLFQLKGAERTAARWVNPQKPGTSVRVDSAVGQMRMFRPRNKWAAVQYCRRREELEVQGVDRSGRGTM